MQMLSCTRKGESNAKNTKYRRADTQKTKHNKKQNFLMLESHALRTRHTGKRAATCDVSILRTVWANLYHEISQLL